MTLKFKARVWVYSGMGGWHFVTLPPAQTKKVREAVPLRKGFGSVRVHARIGKTEWQTSIFPDKRSQSYVLPIKAAVRKAESIANDKSVQVELRLA